jgi:WD40 repeat protein
MMPEPEGRIITFYSYKGGTGRSMILANVAWILASNGKRVLTLDWDLEAPGLHRYFYPFLLDKDIAASDGIINFVDEFKRKAMTPPAPGETLEPDWYVSYANILRYAAALRWDFPPGGRLDFVPAGRQDRSYPEAVNSFDWQEFYARLGGGKFLEAARQHMKRNYDYTLIDSRTGVSDTSGICTMQFPDDLVICYTLNNQSIRGAAAVAAAAATARGEALRIFPVPMRVDPFEKDKLDLRRQLAKQMFASFPAHLQEAEREVSYRANTLVPYIPYYAYEEILATFGDPVPAASGSLLESVERITAFLIGPEFKAQPVREGLRQRILAEFKGESPEPLVERAEEALEQLSPEDHEAAKRLLTRLVRVAAPGEQADDKPVSFNLRDLSSSIRTVTVIDTLAKAGILTFRRDEIGFAKDGVLRSWQRLREWTDDDREFLFWRQGVWKLACDWSSVQDNALLLKGSDLKTAQNWLLRRKADLLPLEITFIKTSQSRSRRTEMVTQAVGLAVMALAVCGLVYWQAEARWNPDLLGQASANGIGRVDLTPVASETLLTFNGTGASVWNAKTAKTQVTVKGDVDVSPDGDFLLSPAGEVVQTLTAKQYKIPISSATPVVLDLSGEFGLIYDHGIVRIWSLAAGQQSGELKMEMPDSADQPAYVTSAGDRFITDAGLWDVHKGMPLSKLIPREQARSSQVSSFVVSEKASRIASVTGVYPPERAGTKLASDTGVHPPEGERITLWDLKTGEEIRSAQLPTDGAGSRGGVLIFLHDSYLFLRSNGESYVFNTSDLAPAPSCQTPGSLLSVVTNAKASLAVVCSAPTSSDLVLWNVKSDQPITLKGFSVSTLRAGSAVAMSADQSRLLAVRKTGQAELWDCGSGQKIKDLDLSYKDVSGNQVSDSRAASGDFTMDGSALSVRLEGGAIMLYAAGTGARIAVLENAGGTGQEVYYDAACRRANVWTDTGRVLRYTEGKTIIRWFVPSKSCDK